MKKTDCRSKGRAYEKQKTPNTDVKNKSITGYCSRMYSRADPFFRDEFFFIRKIQNQIYENNQNLLRSNVNQLDAELNKISGIPLNESTMTSKCPFFIVRSGEKL